MGLCWWVGHCLRGFLVVWGWHSCRWFLLGLWRLVWRLGFGVFGMVWRWVPPHREGWFGWCRSGVVEVLEQAVYLTYIGGMNLFVPLMGGGR